MESKKSTENGIAWHLTVYEDPVPVDLPNLIAPEEHQVGQDQHGGGTRREGSVASTASLRGEELDLWGERQGGVSSQG